ARARGRQPLGALLVRADPRPRRVVRVGLSRAEQEVARGVLARVAVEARPDAVLAARHEQLAARLADVDRAPGLTRAGHGDREGRPRALGVGLAPRLDRELEVLCGARGG